MDTKGQMDRCVHSPPSSMASRMEERVGPEGLQLRVMVGWGLWCLCHSVVTWLSYGLMPRAVALLHFLSPPPG